MLASPETAGPRRWQAVGVARCSSILGVCQAHCSNGQVLICWVFWDSDPGWR